MSKPLGTGRQYIWWCTKCGHIKHQFHSWREYDSSRKRIKQEAQKASAPCGKCAHMETLSGEKYDHASYLYISLKKPIQDIYPNEQKRELNLQSMTKDMEICTQGFSHRSDEQLRALLSHQSLYVRSGSIEELTRRGKDPRKSRLSNFINNLFD